jgi:hypothetical protein
MATNPAVGGTSPGALRPARPAGRMGTEEYHSGSLPTAQEAAVLFSANHAQAAAALLSAEIKDTVGRNNKQAWLMLFDLHQVARDREAFEQLSMLFTVKFEQSPPVWIDEAESSDPRRNTQTRERKDFFALKPAPSGELASEIDKFLAFAESQGTVRLDVAKITSLTGDEAKRLAAGLTHLRKKQMPMWFNNLESLEKLLRASINEKAGPEQRPYWPLLFELLILQGRAEAFEELGMEFAVAFEMSPPNWEVYVNKVAEACKGRDAGDGRPAGSGSGVPLERRARRLERAPAGRSQYPCRSPGRGGHRHGQGAAHRLRLHGRVLRRGEGDPARRQARDPHGIERDQRRAAGGVRGEPLRHPCSP